MFCVCVCQRVRVWGGRHKQGGVVDTSGGGTRCVVDTSKAGAGLIDTSKTGGGRYK